MNIKLIYKIKNKNCILLKFCFIQILVRKYFIRNEKYNVQFAAIYPIRHFYLNSKFSLSYFFFFLHEIKFLKFILHYSSVLFKCQEKKPVLFGIITYFRNLKNRYLSPFLFEKIILNEIFHATLNKNLF